MLDLRAELGTGESLRPLASDLAREEDEDRREAEQGGSTCQESMCFIKVKALLGKPSFVKKKIFCEITS